MGLSVVVVVGAAEAPGGLNTKLGLAGVAAGGTDPDDGATGGFAAIPNFGTADGTSAATGVGMVADF